MDGQEHNESTSYATAKRYFKTGLEQMLAAGRSAGEFAEFVRERFGENVQPHLREFMTEVRAGSVKVKGLTRSAITAMRGHSVTPEQRDQMIREAAYYRAQRRGFDGGGTAEEDWRAAEAEIDARLWLEAGVVERSRKLLGSAAETAEVELGNIKRAVTAWMEARRTAMAQETPPAAPAIAAPMPKSTAKRPPHPKKAIATGNGSRKSGTVAKAKGTTKPNKPRAKT